MQHFSKTFSLFLLLTFGSIAFAQTEYDEDDPVSRIFVGGNLGLQLGTVTMIDISPMAGYNLLPFFSAGIGGTYTFINFRQGNQVFRTSNYGARVFTRFLLGQSFLLHAEYEQLNFEDFVFNPNSGGFELKRFWWPATFAGIGYRSPAGNNSFFTLTLLYNIMDTPNNPHPFYFSPIVIRAGFVYGLYRP